MKKQNFFVSLLLLCGCVSMGAWGQQPLSLSDCLLKTYQNSPQILKSIENVNKSVEQTKQAQSNVLPQVYGSMEGDYNYSRATTEFPFPKPIGTVEVETSRKYAIQPAVAVSWDVLNTSSYKTIKVYKSQTVLAKNLHIKTVEDVIYNTINSYFSLMVANEQIKLYRFSLDNQQKILGVSKAKLESGLIKQVDYERLKVKEQNLIQQISNVQYTIDQNVNTLLYLMNDAAGIKFDASDSLKTTIIPLEEILNLDLKEVWGNTIQSQIIENQITTNNMQLSAVQSSRIPVVSIFNNNVYAITSNDLSNFNSPYIGTVGMKVKFPIFTSGNINAKIKEYKISSTMLDFDKQNYNSQAVMNFRTARDQYNNISRIIEALKNNVKTASYVTSVKYDQFNTGLCDVTDYLNAQNDLLDAQNSYISSLIKLKLSEVQLFQTSGYMSRYIAKLEKSK